MSNSSSDNNFQLSNVFEIQNNYLSNMDANKLINANQSVEVAKYVSDLQKKLQNTSETYEKANTSSNALLTEQEKVKSILEAEQDRLDEKKEIIDNALFLEERKNLFTDTQRLEYSAWTKIMLVIVIMLCIHIGLRMISGHYGENMPQAGNVVLTLLQVVNFTVSGLIIMYMYLNLQSRSEINYNRFNIPPPNPDDFVTDSTSTPSSTLLQSLGVCYEDSCCGEGTHWDSATSNCVSSVDVSSTSSAAGVQANTDASNLGNSINSQAQQVTSVKKNSSSPLKKKPTNTSGGTAATTNLSANQTVAKAESDMYAGFDEITNTFNKNMELANTKSKSLVAKKAINTAKTAAQMKQNAVTSTPTPTPAPSPSPGPAGNEGFVTYNELYNVHNSLLPCKVEYPYKNSDSAQANDNLVYMKKYA
jgi:hypothetical protein